MKVEKQSFRHYFDFLWAMTEKEIKARYKNTVFGFLWMVLNPLFQMIVIGVIFSFFIEVPVNNYFLFLFSGLLPWQFFSLSLSNATTAFVRERYLLQKARFPLETIPLSIILANFFHFLTALTLLIVFLTLTGRVNFTNLLLLIPAVLTLLVFTTGSSLLAASLHTKYRDVKFIVQALLLVWFYATPILYSLTMLPSSLGFIFNLNPLAVVFEMFHIAIAQQSWSGMQVIWGNLAILALVTFVGIRIFQRESHYFVDWL